MKIIKKLQPKKTIIISAALCCIGVAFVGFLQTPSDNIALNQLEKNLANENKSNSPISTTELINASAERVQTKENIQKSYPNITPKKLEKPFSSTLEGTEIDGQLKVGEDGQLVVDIQVKDFFDYFLSATAEVSPELALDELLGVANKSLPPEVFKQVQAMLDNYLAYKEAAISYMSQPLAPSDQQTMEYQLQVMEESIKELRSLRREHMPENQVEAFFGLEEAYEDFTLASIKIQNNPNLSPEEIQLALQAQRDLLPDLIRTTENRMVDDIKTNQEVNTLLLSNRDDADVENALRQNGLNDNAIKDALAYRQQQRAFEQQYEMYKQERDQLLSASLSEADLASQKEQLLKKYFHSEESITQAKVKDLSS